jgi:hypothetical protein
MKWLKHWGRRGRSLLMSAMVCLIASNAAAQGAVGSGPLTSSLATAEPTSGVLRLGPLRVAPGLTIREIGTDDNVFNESVDPKRDFVMAGTPDVSVFTRLRFVQISAYAGSDMQYYQTYESERSIGHSLKGRVDLIAARLFPFFGAGQVHNRMRPNGEIDVRADIQNNELSGGLGYEVSANSQVFAAVIETDVDYQDAFEDGVSLEQSLTHGGTEYMGGLKTALTPLLTMQLRGTLKKDKFKFEPTRNGETWSGTASFSFDRDAFINGIATFGYQDYQPDDPLVSEYRGLTASVALAYPLLEIGRFNLGYQHGIDYSFDVQEGYYVNNSFSLAYTQRLFGEVDLQVQGTRATFDYGQREGSQARQDTLDSVNGNLGYNLRNRSRVALNYEFTERESPAIAARNYVRRRIFLSWLVAF